MAGYLVMKLPNGVPVAFIHTQEREVGAITLSQHGDGLLFIEDATGHDDAEEKAQAYWNGTYSQPESINEWIEEALRKR